MTLTHYGSDLALQTVENHKQFEHNITRIFKRRPEDQTEFITSITLSDLKNMFEEKQGKQEEKYNTLNSNMDVIMKQNNHTRASMQLLSKKKR